MAPNADILGKYIIHLSFRARETAMERQSRLQKMNSAIKERRSNETKDEKKIRLEKVRLHMQKSR